MRMSTNQVARRKSLFSCCFFNILALTTQQALGSLLKLSDPVSSSVIIIPISLRQCEGLNEITFLNSILHKVLHTVSNEHVIGLIIK